jgi:hypothetical protein
MYEDIEEFRQLRNKYNPIMFKSGIRAFQEIEGAEARAFRDGAMSRKNKELIALGISIHHHCYG